MPNGCGCGGSRNGQVTIPGGAGPLPLSQYPDCTELYSGPDRVIVVVARSSPNERLYPGWELGDAAVYSGQHGDAPIETIKANRLCAAAVLSVAS